MTAQEAVKVLREQFGKGRLAITLYPLHGEGARIHVEGESIADAVTVAPDALPSLAQRAREAAERTQHGKTFGGVLVELAERVDEHERLLKDSPLHPKTKWNRFTKEDHEWAESKLLEGLQKRLDALLDVAKGWRDAQFQTATEAVEAQNRLKKAIEEEENIREGNHWRSVDG